MATFGPVTVVSIPVADQDRAKAFFVDTLGFALETDITTPAMRWVQVGPPQGGTSFSLVTWFDQMRPGGLRGIVLNTDDIEAKRADLIARGVAMEEIDDQPYGRFSSFEDVDGNGYILMQPPDGMTRP